MEDKETLNNKLSVINQEIEDISEDLKHNLEFVEIDKINLYNYHLQLSELISKRELLKDKLFYNEVQQ